MPKLFQPFLQADTSLTRQFGGMALGLPIAKHLARLMGGDITVQSKEQAGSIFQVTFAVNTTEHPLDATLYSGILLQNNVEQPLIGLNILVVDDSKVNQIVITKMVLDAGVMVQTAENGQLAIKTIETSEQEFDCILMDM